MCDAVLQHAERTTYTHICERTQHRVQRDVLAIHRKPFKTELNERNGNERVYLQPECERQARSEFSTQHNLVACVSCRSDTVRVNFFFQFRIETTVVVYFLCCLFEKELRN